MDVSFVESTVNLAAKHCLGFDRIGKLLLLNSNSISTCLSSAADQATSAMSISALIVDAVAPPRTTSRNSTKLRMRKKRRLRRRSIAGGGGGGDGVFDGEDGGGFLGDGDGGGGGGYFGGGGGGWRFGGGGWGWGDGLGAAGSDPASDFVYEVICWIALSNCVHFAFKRVVRGVGELVEEKREKAVGPMRLGSIC